MKYIKFLLIFVFSFAAFSSARSQAPQGKDFGFGIKLGEPTGLTAKLWTQNDQAVAIDIGNSYLGALRIGADYLFHFMPFKSKILNMYAGPGLAVGIGESQGWWYHDHNKYWYKSENELGFGVRGVFGINIVPKRTPLEIFGEIGVLIGLVPGTHANAEGAVGIRFYF